MSAPQLPIQPAHFVLRTRMPRTVKRPMEVVVEDLDDTPSPPTAVASPSPSVAVKKRFPRIASAYTQTSQERGSLSIGEAQNGGETCSSTPASKSCITSTPANVISTTAYITTITTKHSTSQIRQRRGKLSTSNSDSGLILACSYRR